MPDPLSTYLFIILTLPGHLPAAPSHAINMHTPEACHAAMKGAYDDSRFRATHDPAWPGWIVWATCERGPGAMMPVPP
jgi:hypothetical protein